MFGQNEVAELNQQVDGSLNINSLFYTIQGEGPDAGCPAIFLRLATCNLRCFFCDTEFEQGKPFPMQEVLANVMLVSHLHKCHLVVITGGEPLLQNIVPLVRKLNQHGVRVSVETAGTVYVPGLEQLFASNRDWRGNLIVCSPKTPKLNEQVARLVGAFKYVVSDDQIDPEDGLPIMSTQLKGEPARIYRPSLMERGTVPIYLQPCDTGDPIDNMANLKAAAAACMKHGYRLSVQVHKLANLP